MLPHSSLVPLRGLSGDLVWFWLLQTCALQMPEGPLGDSYTVLQELPVVMTASNLEKAFTNSFVLLTCVYENRLEWWFRLLKPVICVKEQSFFLLSQIVCSMCQCSESWPHRRIVSVWSVLQGKGSVTYSERLKAFKTCMCFAASNNWFYVKLLYDIGFGFCPSEVM